MKNSHQILLIIISGCWAGNALAQKSGDVIINFGAAHVSPNAHLKSVSSSEPNVHGALQGSSISSSSTDTLSFGASYMLTDNFAAELAFGIPPKIKLSMKAPSGSHPDALNTTVVFPALLANYYFGNPSNAFRPFVGAGVSYIRFTENSHNTSDPVITGLASESITINPAWSPVFKLGASYKINEKWFVSGAALLMPLNVKGQLSGSGIGAGPATTNLSMKMNSKIYLFSLNYTYQ